MPEEPKQTTDSNSLEHPISELDAKKYAGQGDFNLPVSPLDQLPGMEAAQVASVQPTTPPPSPVAASSVKPEPVVDPSLTHPVSVVRTTKADTAVTAQPIPGKDLETEAKKLLKDIDSNSPPKKKKKRGRAATRMALAAVLVVMMGAGGVVGMNLLKMQQVGDSRSQADTCTCTDGTNTYAEGSYGCSGFDTRVKCVSGAHGCGWQSGFGCDKGSQTCKTSFTNGQWNAICEDIPGTGGTCVNPFFCRTGTSSSCAGGGIPAIETPDKQCCVLKDGLDCGDGTNKCVSSCVAMGDGESYCTANSCSNLGKANCTVVMYHSDKRDTSPLWVSNCKVNPVEGDVETLVCLEDGASLPPAGERCGSYQIDVLCDGHNVDSISSRNDDCGDEPEPTPGPTPPPQSYSCADLTKNIPTPKFGETVTFTCSGQGVIDHYEFRYKVGTGAFTSLTATNNTTSLKIEKIGLHTVECRVCKSATECTAWGMAQ